MTRLFFGSLFVIITTLCSKAPTSTVLRVLSLGYTVIVLSTDSADMRHRGTDVSSGVTLIRKKTLTSRGQEDGRYKDSGVVSLLGSYAE